MHHTQQQALSVSKTNKQDYVSLHTFSPIKTQKHWCKDRIKPDLQCLSVGDFNALLFTKFWM